MYWIQHTQNGDKDGKALYKLMNNAIYGKPMKNLKNRIDLRLVNNEKDYLKWTSKPSYMLHHIFDNNVVLIRKSKIGLILNKPAYNGMCILELSKILMYKFHYDDIKKKLTTNQNYYSQKLIV